ncbi:hypothetical protein ACP4OV_029693 [Aristida adscensionis]
MAMKPHAVLLLVVTIAAASCATTCVASGAEAPAPARRCDPVALRPCAAAVIWEEAPSAACCAELRRQRPCLCVYGRNRYVRGYVNSQDGRRVAAACHLRPPRCYS